MPRVYVEYSRFVEIGNRCKTVAFEVNTIRTRFIDKVQQLDWDVCIETDINSKAAKISGKLELYSRVLESYQQFIESAHKGYIQLDKYRLTDDSVVVQQKEDNVVTLPEKNEYDWREKFKNVSISKAYIIPTVLSLVSPTAGMGYIVAATSGVLSGKPLSFADNNRMTFTNAGIEGVGSEPTEEGFGRTAWCGKAYANAQNKWGYAGINTYFGKAEAKADADTKFMNSTMEKKKRDEKWDEERKKKIVDIGCEVGGSVSALAIEAEAGLGNDTLGIEGKVEGTVMNGEIGGEGKIEVDEKGVDAYLEGEAMVAALEGEASASFNILGLEIKGTVGGYAGAFGAEGKIGIKDNTLVIDGGAAAFLGVSAGIEIGINEDGWNNLLSYIGVKD